MSPLPKLRFDEALNAGMVPLLEELGFSRRTPRSRTFWLEKPEIRMWVDFRATRRFPRGFRERTGVYFPAIQKLADELLGDGFETGIDYPQPLHHSSWSVLYLWDLELDRAHIEKERQSWWYRNWGPRLPLSVDDICPYANGDDIWQIEDELPVLKGEFVEPSSASGAEAEPAVVGAFMAEKWRHYCLPWVRRALDMGPAFRFWDDEQSDYPYSPTEYEPHLTVGALLTRALFYHAIGDKAGRDRNIEIACRPDNHDHKERQIQMVLSGEARPDDLSQYGLLAKERLQAEHLRKLFGVR